MKKEEMCTRCGTNPGRLLYKSSLCDHCYNHCKRCDKELNRPGTTLCSKCSESSNKKKQKRCKDCGDSFSTRTERESCYGCEPKLCSRCNTNPPRVSGEICEDCYKHCDNCGRDLIQYEYKTSRLCNQCEYPSRQLVCECGKIISPGSESCRKCRVKRGPYGNALPLGTKRHNSEGYVFVKIDDQPNQYNTNWRFEHHIVMEESLGRSLLPGENVHHVNGVRDDNRLENLELWVTMQPSGQRAIDLVSYAYEILERYEKDVKLGVLK